MATKQRPETVFQPKAGQALLRGVSRMAAALRPTLGPQPRWVAMARDVTSRPPELLDDGATIARRIIQVSDRDEDMGAMLLRHAIWQVHKEVGDGAATTAVIAEALLREAVRHIAAGFNAMGMRAGIEKGLAAARAALQAQVQKVEGEEAIRHAALSLCADEEIAGVLAEVFDIVGADGMVMVENGRGRTVEREYIEGAYWDSGWHTPHFVTDPAKQEAHLHNVAILISDFAIKEQQPLVSVMQMALKGGAKGLMVIAQDVSSEGLGLLLLNRQKKVLETLAVKTPHFGDRRLGALTDIAMLTGGRALFANAGDAVENIQPTDLGRASLGWSSRRLFGIKGGQSDPRALRAHIATLRAQLAQATKEDERNLLRERVGKLLGGTATVRVGGATERERDARKAVAEQAVTAMRLALTSGMVPGGGAALLACRAAVLACAVGTEDERVGLHALARALEEPTRAITENAGYEASPIIARLNGQSAGWGFDVRQGALADLRSAGVLDVGRVVDEALQAAVSAATMALTTDVLIHTKKPRESTEP